MEEAVRYVRERRKEGDSDDKIRRSLREAGWSDQDIINVFEHVEDKKTESTSVLKWIGLIAIGFLLAVTAILVSGPFLYIATLYAGLTVFAILGSRPSLRSFLPAVVTASGSYLVPSVTFLLFSASFPDHPRLMSLLQMRTEEVLLTLSIFTCFPIILYYLQAGYKDEEKLFQSPVLVQIYTILLNVFYFVYWLHRIQSGVRARGGKTRSLWWLLVPLVGPILIYYTLSTSLEEITGRSFYAWFFVLLCVNGFQTAIVQYLINKDLGTRKDRL